MTGSPLGSSPYEVLGVPADAPDAELRRAFRRRLRQTHPDHGGSRSEFDAVQAAWRLVGTPEARADFDRGRGSAGGPADAFAPAPPAGRRNSRPQARSSGHPGGLNRERYLGALRDWVGLGDPIADPYDPALVRSAPARVRRLLAGAIAEERTAVELAELGMGFTIWHDVATDRHPVAERLEAGKIDHLVLGPTGLWAIRAEDLGGPVSTRRGELVAEALEPGERPVHELADRARTLARAARVRVSALVVALPDGAVDGVVPLGAHRGMPAFAIERSRLADAVRRGLPGVATGGTELFETRTRLQSIVRFA